MRMVEAATLFFGPLHRRRLLPRSPSPLVLTHVANTFHLYMCHTFLHWGEGGEGFAVESV